MGAPKNLKYSGSVPSQRMNRFWRNPGTLTNQPFLGKSIDVFADTIMGRLIHNSPDNTATGDIRNCFILWFHQDMPADIESSPPEVSEAPEPVVLRKTTKPS